MRKLVTAALAATAVLALASVASASNTAINGVSYEFDNGTSWTLQKNTAALNSTYANPTYSDAGIVVDLGPAEDFDGLTFEPTDGPVVANIWLGDGSEPNTPGTHPLADPVDFSYGPYGGTFWTGDQAGNPVTTAFIRTLGSVEVYAWVGVVYDGVNDVSGSVSSVNGHSVGNRTFSFTNNGDGTVTAAIH